MEKHILLPLSHYFSTQGRSIGRAAVLEPINAAAISRQIRAGLLIEKLSQNMAYASLGLLLIASLMLVPCLAHVGDYLLTIRIDPADNICLHEELKKGQSIAMEFQVRAPASGQRCMHANGRAQALCKVAPFAKTRSF
jgi:hypothetical protein